MIEMDLVIDEELTADDEEQDDAGKDLGKIAVEAKLGGDFIGAAGQEHQQQRGKDHGEGIELGEPGNHDGGEAAAIHEVGIDGVGGAADQQQTGQAADSAGKSHGADDDLFDIDADVMGGIFAFAHNGDLIAVLAVPQIDVHGDADDGDDKDIEQILDAENFREPAVGEQIGADNIGAGLIRHLEEVFHQLDGDIVHHKGEEGLIGVPVGLKEGRDNAPDNAGEDGGNCHDEDEQTIGHFAAQHQHAYRGGKAADEHLAFGAGIPEAHAEGRGDRQRDAQQNGDIMQGDQHTAGAERAVEDGGVDGEGSSPVRTRVTTLHTMSASRMAMTRMRMARPSGI